MESIDEEETVEDDSLVYAVPSVSWSDVEITSWCQLDGALKANSNN